MKPKALIIAEKGSLARLYRQAFKEAGYKMPYDYDVLPLQGNVVELKEPEDIDPKLASWTADSLPILPQKWEYKPIKAKKNETGDAKRFKNQGYDLFKTVKKALSSGKYQAVVNGCDPDREGQAIFDKLMLLMPKEAQELKQLRLWQDDQETSTAIKYMTKPYDNKDPEIAGMGKEAMSRGVMDWLFGLNASRAFTIRNRAQQAVHIGRGMTAILGIVVNREDEINHFVSKPFWQIHADLNVGDGASANLVDGETLAQKNFDRKNEADELVKNLTGNPAIVQEFIGRDGKVSKTKAPNYFSTTGIEKVLTGGRYNYSNKEIEDALEHLYEAKITSYPRTPSTTMTSTMGKRLDALITIAQSFNSPVSSLKISTEAKDRLLKDKKYIKPAKKTAHTCLMFMGRTFDFSRLTKVEKDICTLIAIRLICSLLPPEQHINQRALFKIKDQTFKMQSTALIDPGWTKYDPSFKGSYSNLPELKQGESCEVKQLVTDEKHTTPPTHYTVSKMMDTMEHVGRLYGDDKKLKDIIKDLGIGTDATRGALITKNTQLGYWQVQKGNRLMPTELGTNIIHNLGNNMLVSPKTTAQWELKLKDIYEGNLSTKDFVKLAEQGTKQITKDILTSQNQAEIKNGHDDKIIGKCPIDGGDIIEKANCYVCSNAKSSQDADGNWHQEGCKFFLPKSLSLLKSGKITPTDMKAILNGKTTKVKSMVSSKKKAFKAAIKWDSEKQRLGLVFNDDHKEIGTCPIDGGKVFMTDNGFICENHHAVKQADGNWTNNGCAFAIPRSFKIFAKNQKPLSEQDGKLLISGQKTGLIKFHSSKKNKDYEAKLYYDKEKQRLRLSFEDSTRFKCPLCQRPLVERSGKYGKFLACPNKDFILTLDFHNHNFTDDEVQRLLNGEKIHINDFVWKSGNSGSGYVQIEDNKLKLSFD